MVVMAAGKVPPAVLVMRVSEVPSPMPHAKPQEGMARGGARGGGAYGVI